MTYEEAVRKWAAGKLGIEPSQVRHVAIETDVGWAGTDVTAGDSPSCTVVAHLVGGRQREILDLFEDENGYRGMYTGRSWDFVDLLKEILDQ